MFNKLDQKLPNDFRGGGGVGGGGNLGVFQPLFQDLCSTGKNKVLLTQGLMRNYRLVPVSPMRIISYFGLGLGMSQPKIFCQVFF